MNKPKFKPNTASIFPRQPVLQMRTTTRLHQVGKLYSCICTAAANTSCTATLTVVLID